MPDMMMFPKTVDEFMEQYKIVDSDEVYTNGAELIPIFRMKQWFEHIDAVPVKRGKWVLHYDEAFPADATIECSICHEEQPACIDDNYCPNCGAKMDEVAE